MIRRLLPIALLLAGVPSAHGAVTTDAKKEDPPVADIVLTPNRSSTTADFLVYDGEPLSFDGSGSYDPDGGALTKHDWTINYASGKPKDYAGAVFDTSYALVNGSLQTMRLLIRDNENNYVSKTVTIEVVAAPAVVWKRTYFIRDHLGSVRVAFNEEGEVVEATDYYPFGLEMPTRSFVAGAGVKENYTGHELDSEVGLLYAGARYLDPKVGRWLSVDPLAASGAGINPYAYSFNNPVSFLDPNGEWPFSFHIQSFHPNASFGSVDLGLLGSTSAFEGDDRGFTLASSTARVHHMYTIEADNGMLSGRTLRSDRTRRLSDGDEAFAAPMGGVARTGSPGSWEILSQYEGSNPLTPVFGSSGPAIDVIASLMVMGGRTGDKYVRFIGSVYGDDYPNTQMSVADVAGNQLFLGVDVRSGRPERMLPGGPSANIMNFDVTV